MRYHRHGAWCLGKWDNTIMRIMVKQRSIWVIVMMIEFLEQNKRNYMIILPLQKWMKNLVFQWF